MKVLNFILDLVKETVAVFLFIGYLTLPTMVAVVAKNNLYLFFHVVTLGTMAVLFKESLKLTKETKS